MTVEPPRKCSRTETEGHAPSIAEIEALLRLAKERVRQLERHLGEIAGTSCEHILVVRYPAACPRDNGELSITECARCGRTV